MSKQKKVMLILVGAELVLILALVPFFLFSTYNSDNVKKYADAKNIPVVTADYGRLEFDSVRVTVPTEGASYAIGYDWAKHDKEYPSVPSSASVSYSDEADKVLYEVMLYRDKVTPKEKDGKEYSLDMWFDEWEQGSKGSGAQKSYKTPDTKGFLIQTGGDIVQAEATEEESAKTTDAASAKDSKDANEEASDEAASETSEETSEEKNTYCSYTYYFAVETDSDIEQYVLELDFYDPEYIGKAESIFKEIADSISTGNSAHA